MRHALFAIIYHQMKVTELQIKRISLYASTRWLRQHAAYLPTQKCENTSFTTDSVVRSPVSSVKAFSASSRTMLTASRVMPPLTASSASEMQLIALSRHCFWRSFTESSSHTLLSVIINHTILLVIYLYPHPLRQRFQQHYQNC